MRLLVLLLRNAFGLLFAALALPLRARRARHRPEWVRFRLAHDPPYQATSRGWGRFRRVVPGTVRSLREFREQVGRIVKDPRAKGVVVVLDGFTGSAAKRATVALAFDEVRAAGKQVVGYAVSAGNGEFELLCAADRILMPAAGRLELVGYAAEATAVGAGLRKLGVTAHFVRRGDHKTAPELFTCDEASPIQRQTLEQMLGERFAALVSAIARGRRLSADVARERIDAGPYSARRALAVGLIDALVDEDDLGRSLAGLSVPAPADDKEPSKGARVAGYKAWAACLPVSPRAWRPLRRRVRVAVVPLAGMIVHGRGGGGGAGPRLCGSDDAAGALQAAAGDPRCRAIVLHIDSPGGSALASELILEQVKRAARKKPVVAYFDQVAASGGYMAALGAKEIWAAPLAIAGSIGVFAGKFDLSVLLQRLGVHQTLVTQGANAALFSSSRAFTDPERATLEATIEETYQDFLAHVALARKRTRDEIHARAEGRIYSGTAAVEAGLVDRTGLFDEACARALELAGQAGAGFELALFRPPAPRLTLLNALRLLGSAGVYALWYPWFEFPDRAGLSR